MGEKLKRTDIFNWVKKKKLDICVLVDTHCTPDLEKRWKNEWGYEAYFASVASNSRGVAIVLQNTFEFKVNKYKAVLDNDALILDIVIRSMHITLVGIYGPNKDSPNFFTGLQSEIEIMGNMNVIIAGDFNVVQNYDLDCYKYKTRPNKKAKERLQGIMNDAGYTDIWRVLNPNRKRYTWKGSEGKRGRLDYFLISENLSVLCNKPNISPGYRSDHNLVSIEMELSDQTRGRGIWKFNNSLLTDPNYINIVKNVIMETEDQYRSPNNDHNHNPETQNFIISDQLFFETLKLQIRGATIKYSTFKKRENLKRENDIENRIKVLDSKTDHTAEESREMKELENELIIIRERYIKGVITRAKAKEAQEGEKCSKYFCNLEKKHYTEKIMYKLITEENHEIYKTEDIMEEQKRYFSNLYKETENINNAQNNMFLNRDNPYLSFLTEEEKNMCDEPLTLAECLKYLKGMENGKSPGGDGFTTEFYKFFWKDIGPYLFRSFKDSLGKGEMSITQKQGIITLLPKEDKPKEYLKNWRPITLLNTDYKIFSGALSKRLQNITERIINQTQKGFIRGRDISECTRLTYDILQESKRKKITALLLLVDFEKAFDMLSHDYINNCLEFFGFGPIFRRYISTLLKNINSCILYNGHRSSFFQVERGTRQGDPISPDLFVLCISTLAAALLYDPQINGITLEGTEYLLSQFADDMTLMLDGSEGTLRSVFIILSNFKLCSGLKVNVEKTKAVWIGKDYDSNKEICTDINIKWIKDKTFNILGVEYDLTKEDITGVNYDKKLAKIKKLFSCWAWRNLTIFGKLTVVKNLAIPKLVHLFRALPNPSEKFFKELDSMCYSFIWDKKPDKIKRNILISDYENGGIKMLHVRNFCDSMKLFWIKKLLDNEIVTDWKTLNLDIFSKFGGNLIWNYHPNSFAKISKNLNQFWKDILCIWGKLYVSPQNFRSQPLWYNSNIKVGNKEIFYRDWSIRGINYVNDLLNNDGIFFSDRDFASLLDLENNLTLKMKYRGILAALPLDWKNDIIDSEIKLTNITTETVDQVQGKQRYKKNIYKLMCRDEFGNVEYLKEKWETKLGILNIDINLYFSNIHKHHKDTYLRSFQYKIMHRILPTNYSLFKMKISNESLCTFCNSYIESLEHIFWECTSSKNIWLSINESLELEQKFENFKFNKETIFFGYNSDTPHISGINIFITLIKSYIYKCKLKYLDLSFRSAKFFLISNCKIQKSIDFVNADREWAFLDDWLR